MTNLVVRNMQFDFSGVPFIWNPANPEFSLLANILSFQAIGFERFICRSMTAAQDRVTDTELRKEIIEFKSQEMAHSKAHLAHVRSIIDLYPKLQDAFDESLEDFDKKWEAHDLAYQLAYSAIIEATSLPLYKIIIHHRDKLMAGGDSRVASLLLWHFCEELEHRSSALRVYQTVVGRPFYRMRVFPDVGGHLARNMNRIGMRFAEHVPEVAGLDIRLATARIPRRDRLKMVVKLFSSQLPFYDPARGRLPPYCTQWAQRYEAGEDMREAYRD